MTKVRLHSGLQAFIQLVDDLLSVTLDNLPVTQQLAGGNSLMRDSKDLEERRIIPFLLIRLNQLTGDKVLVTAVEGVTLELNFYPFV
jgi:hypothetical protein